MGPSLLNETQFTELRTKISKKTREYLDSM